MMHGCRAMLQRSTPGALHVALQGGERSFTNRRLAFQSLRTQSAISDTLCAVGLKETSVASSILTWSSFRCERVAAKAQFTERA